MKIFTYIIFMLGLLLTVNSMAHTDEYLDTQARHGGQVRMVGAYHLELVVGEKILTVYVTDHVGNPITTKNITGNATIMLAEQTKITLDLKPTEKNILTGQGEFTAAPEMTVAVTVTLPGQTPQPTSFTPLAKKSSKPEVSPSKSTSEHSH